MPKTKTRTERRDLAPQYRHFAIRAEHVDEEARTVELSFSSEERVDRGYMVEILDHDASSVRMGRLRNSAPLLVNHDSRTQIGAVVAARIGEDRRGHATVKFSKNGRGEEEFRDVLDGIRTKVSVGYRIHKMVLEGMEEDTEILRATDWEPFEISIVSVPADDTVGVGRSAGSETATNPLIVEVTDMTDEERKAKADAEAKAEAERKAREAEDERRRAEERKAAEVRAVDEAREAELKRIDQLTQLGEQFARFGGVELAKQFVRERKTVEDLRAAILEKIGAKPAPNAEVGLTNQEVRRYSFLRALNALANPTNLRVQEAAAYEREVSEAAAKAAGKDPQGFMVPMEVLRAPLVDRPQQQRDLTVGTATQGGYTVGTDVLASSMIELLRNRMVLQQAGMRMLNGLSGNVAIPRVTGGATAYWVGEGSSPTESQQAFDQVGLTPKTVGAFTDITRKLLIQSSIDVEGFVRSDLATILALELDRVGLYGLGAGGEPLGLNNTTGIGAQTIASASDATYAELVGMESDVATANADVGALAYIVTALERGNAKVKTKDAGSGQFVWEPGNTLNGYRALVTNALTAGDYWFGNWNDLLMGMWSGLDLMVDPYTNSTSGTVRIVALQDVDIAVRHPESFSKGS